MKKKNLILPFTTLALLFGVGLAACSGNGGSQEASEPETSQSHQQQEKITIKAADGKTTLYLGQTLQLTASVEGVTWESKTPTVATINAEGLVTAVAEGSVQISASKDGFTAGVITLRVQLEPITVTAAEGKTSIQQEQTVQLTASKDGVAWKSSDENIATVSATGLVTALKAGSVTITASKDNFKAGTISITVTRPAALATLHWEDADHYAADGWWGTGDDGAMPIYARDSGNASDAQCIAHFGNGDKETLKFNSNASTDVEIVITMASSNAIDDMSAVMDVTFNKTVLDISGKGFAGGSSSEFGEFSLGELHLEKGENRLEVAFKDASAYPYLDDLAFYAKGNIGITLIPADAKETIEPKAATMTANIGEATHIELTKPASLEGVRFVSSKEDVATVSADGKVTGLKLGTANITIMKEGMYSARIEVTVEKAILQGEIRVEAENTSNDLPSGFHKYTDRTSGIQNGHSGSAYITGYDVSSECSLEYTFESDKDQTMTLIIAGAPHYNMSAGEVFSFASDCEIKLNDVAITVAADAEIEGTGAAMGAATVEVTIGTVQVKAGTNTFVIHFAEKAPALDCYRFMPIA